MDTRNEMEKAEGESLRAQLAELNFRSRWYSSQLWQIPFAYLGITCVVLAGLANKNPKTLAFGLIAAGLFGICVSIHMYGMRNGEHRAVRNLQEIETALKLEPTVEYMPGTYVVPLQLAVILATIVYLIGGAYLYFSCCITTH